MNSTDHGNLQYVGSFKSGRVFAQTCDLPSYRRLERLRLVVTGVILYLVNALIPMDPGVKRIITILVTVVLSIVVVVWLLGFLGVNLQGAFDGRPRVR